MSPTVEYMGRLRGGLLQKIVGGLYAQPNEFPYQVSLEYNGAFQCGGSVINALVILTAAHCLKYKLATRFKVTAGEHNRSFKEGTEQERNVSHIFIHEDYDWDTDQHDVGLLILSSPLRFNAYVGQIAYPKLGSTFSGMAGVSGWGKQTSQKHAQPEDVLMKVNVPIIPKEDCRKVYKRYRMEVTEEMICAGETGKDSCQGDSGGPLVCKEPGGREVVCGVVSHGIGCGNAGIPGIYMDVSHYANWIGRTIHKYQMRGKCKLDSFYCGEDKACIPRGLVCDEKRDCSQGSDEGSCKQFTNSNPNQFRCNNGVSIKTTWVCDDFDDCGDHSDEDKCTLRGLNGSCPANEFSCREDKRCIPIDWRCDGQVDCTDSSDEANCNLKGKPSSVFRPSTLRPWRSTYRPCTSREFRCSPSLCIPLRWRCDNTSDCANGRDELDCQGTEEISIASTTNFPPTTNLERCPGEFHCSGRHGGYCIPTSFLCDGDKDCRFGEDEKDCPSEGFTSTLQLRNLTTTPAPPVVEPCLKSQFQCRDDGSCISQIFVCDLDADCMDGSDEESCPKRSSCSALQWECASGECIYHKFRCDQDPDCHDLSDEHNCTLHQLFINL